jgi:phosphoribosylformimino-5-aminoimidazole carboxamide ribotide isomerase
MNIIPAIDLYEGQCVRLSQGQFSEKKIYPYDPVLLANYFSQQGASDLHVVDLSGTEQGFSQQGEKIIAIKHSSNLRIQTGGGLRDKHSIEKMLTAGIDRVVIGSLAIKNIILVTSLICQYGVDKFVLAFDVNIQGEPMISINGWQEKTGFSLWNFLQHYKQFSGLTLLCTDIARDGMLKGPNIEFYRECINRFPQFKFQASGGVSQVEDLDELCSVGVSAVIVGKAFYENKLTLTQALETVNVN